MIDGEARTTSRSSEREAFAPLMMCTLIIPLLPPVARVILEMQELFPGSPTPFPGPLRTCTGPSGRSKRDAPAGVRQGRRSEASVPPRREVPGGRVIARTGSVVPSEVRPAFSRKPHRRLELLGLRALFRGQ